MAKWGILFIICCLIGISLWLRVRISRYSVENAVEKTHVKPTPLSMAIQDLVATAGGLYLSLLALVTFLKLELPNKIDIFNVSVDLLAVISIILAVVQPFAITVIKKIKGR